MSSDFARKFYGSRLWQRTRESYMKSVGGLCERCLKKGLIVPAEHVHHKIRLTKSNVNNPSITTNWEHLEALCADCHAKEHMSEQSKLRRYTIAEDGTVNIIE